MSITPVDGSQAESPPPKIDVVCLAPHDWEQAPHVTCGTGWTPTDIE
jgi:hypothetical protein